MNRFGLLLVPSLLVACGGTVRDLDPDDDNRVVAKTALRAELGGSDVDVVGVTVDPIDGKRYVFDALAGLYRLDADGAELVFRTSDLIADDAWPQSDITDVAALGGGKFALTALNDGFLYDTNTDTFSRYFCYVPGFIEDEFAPTPIVQLTRSVTYDAQRNKLFAQPQTFQNSADAAPEISQVGQFDIEGGEGYGWIDLDDPAFSAGGIAIDGEGRMLLGEGDRLYRLDLETERFDRVTDLSGHGIGAIGGLAVDGDHALIVDAETDVLYEIQL
ncbi:MAG: hypothetical protein RIT81_35415 [Deltaproteobacteria bacterium]